MKIVGLFAERSERCIHSERARLIGLLHCTESRQRTVLRSRAFEGQCDRVPLKHGCEPRRAIRTQQDRVSQTLPLWIPKSKYSFFF